MQTWSISGTHLPFVAAVGATVTLSGAASSDGHPRCVRKLQLFMDWQMAHRAASPLAKAATPSIHRHRSTTVNGAPITQRQFHRANGGNATLVQSTRHPPEALTSKATTVSTPAFSTNSGNELLLAVSSQATTSGTNTTVTGVTGAGLTWALVKRTNVQSGTAEIWRAFAPTIPFRGDRHRYSFSERGVFHHSGEL